MSIVSNLIQKVSRQRQAEHLDAAQQYRALLEKDAAGKANDRDAETLKRLAGTLNKSLTDVEQEGTAVSDAAKARATMADKARRSERHKAISRERIALEAEREKALAAFIARGKELDRQRHAAGLELQAVGDAETRLADLRRKFPHLID